MPRTATTDQKLVSIYTRTLEQYIINATDGEISEGTLWYHLANFTIAGVAKKHRQPLVVVAAIVAVLSPRVHWSKNIEAADVLIEMVLDGATVDEVQSRLSYIFGANVSKAVAILNETVWLSDIDTLITGQKVNAFFHNLMLHADNRVTIDTWMYRAATGNTDTPQRIYPKMYREISEACVVLAAKHGLTPQQVQAIVWVSIRNQVRG